MRNQTGWTRGILLWGTVLTVLGLVLTVTGLILSDTINNLGINKNFILTAGIMLMLLGMVSLAQYAYVRHDPKAGREMMIKERDERLQFIRAQAGQRAYWISSSMALLLWMWASFGGDAGVPVLSGDLLWFCLAALVILPSIVYAAWIIYGKRNS